MTTKHYINTRRPCAEACEFLRRYATVRAAFEACDRVEWLIWFLRREPPTPELGRALRRIATRCVRETPLSDGRTVWDLLTDERSRRAIEVAERYARGGATDAELTAARDAAAEAADAAYASCAEAAATAAAYASCAAAGAADGAASATAAAYAASATAADATARCAAASAAQCRIIREEIAEIGLQPLRD